MSSTAANLEKRQATPGFRKSVSVLTPCSQRRSVGSSALSRKSMDTVKTPSRKSVGAVKTPSRKSLGAAKTPSRKSVGGKQWWIVVSSFTLTVVSKIKISLKISWKWDWNVVKTSSEYEFNHLLKISATVCCLLKKHCISTNWSVLTLIRLGYFGSWKNWGGGGPIRPPLEISAVDRAIAAKICTMVVCDVIYKIVYLDFPK